MKYLDFAHDLVSVRRTVVDVEAQVPTPRRRTCLADDLIFQLRQNHAPKFLKLPDSLGRTEPNAQGRTYKHGIKTSYTPLPRNRR